MGLDQNETPSFFKFESLDIYHKALDFCHAVSILSNDCSNDAQRLVVNRFFDEALKIVTNISEGSTGTKNLFSVSLQQAKSVIGNCVLFCSLAARHNLINAEKEVFFRNALMEMTKMIVALIVSLQKHDPIDSPL